MDKFAVICVVALNAIALGILYQRFGGTDTAVQLQLQLKSWYSTLYPARGVPTCGLLGWDDYIILSSRVVLGDAAGGGVQPAALHIRGGKIVDIKAGGEAVAAARGGSHVLDFKDAVVSPGVIDVHAHLNEPGREAWEGITSGTAAAAAGGVTTVIDMPLNSDPVTTTAKDLVDKMALAEAKAHVHMGFWAGLVPENARDHRVLGELLRSDFFFGNIFFLRNI